MMKFLQCYNQSCKVLVKICTQTWRVEGARRASYVYVLSTLAYAVQCYQSTWTHKRIIMATVPVSRLTVVSRAAKQSRTSDTTVCYIHERSILIERSLKACYKNLPYEKTTRVIRTTSYH